jgi:hypothetical protein
LIVVSLRKEIQTPVDRGVVNDIDMSDRGRLKDAFYTVRNAPALKLTTITSQRFTGRAFQIQRPETGIAMLVDSATRRTKKPSSLVRLSRQSGQTRATGPGCLKPSISRWDHPRRWHAILVEEEQVRRAVLERPPGGEIIGRSKTNIFGLSEQGYVCWQLTRPRGAVISNKQKSFDLRSRRRKALRQGRKKPKNKPIDLPA